MQRPFSKRSFKTVKTVDVIRIFEYKSKFVSFFLMAYKEVKSIICSIVNTIRGTKMSGQKKCSSLSNFSGKIERREPQDLKDVREPILWILDFLGRKQLTSGDGNNVIVVWVWVPYLFSHLWWWLSWCNWGTFIKDVV